MNPKSFPVALLVAVVFVGALFTPTHSGGQTGDEIALTEAFAHLVANAAEATSDRTKPRITLAATQIREGDRASGVVVTVKDNGKGISADLKEKVFSPFCTTKARGMGLGLPIVKRTIFDHNGRVDIDSSSHGTSVSVMLPVSPNGH